MKTLPGTNVPQLVSPPDGYTYDPEGQRIVQAAQVVMATTGLPWIECLRAAEQVVRRQPPRPAAKPAPARPVALAAPSACQTFQLRAPVTKAGASSFSGVCYAGGLLPDGAVIDLASLARIPARLPVLLNGRTDQIVGHAQVANQATRLVVTQGIFSAVTAAGREAAGLLAEGQPLQLEVAVSGRVQRPDPKAKATTINGRTLRAAAIVQDGRVLSVAIVASGSGGPESYARAA